MLETFLMKMAPSCVVCGARNFRFVRAYRPRHGLFGGSSVACCRQCDLQQVVPMPTLDQLDHYYQSQYRPASVESNSSPYEDKRDMNFRTLSQAECIKALGIQPKSIVDVGCGFGLLLAQLRQQFPQAALSGIEVSEKCRAALNELQIQQRHTTLERESGNPFPELFDLLVCSHVLEHSGNVPLFLSVCHSMVRPDGLVFFEVPNCEFEYGLDIPHVVFFTPETLRATLERVGFQVLNCRACGPSIDRWLPGRRRRLRNWMEDHLPIPLSRSIASFYRAGLPQRMQRNVSTKSTMEGLAKLKEEAKDAAWFQYDQPGFKHGVIRCVAVRKS
jgi:2-polyprenyl-3-methyl-5-hydroxy-6-metoxy-1,4-benzoquinol methylase